MNRRVFAFLFSLPARFLLPAGLFLGAFPTTADENLVHRWVLHAVPASESGCLGTAQYIADRFNQVTGAPIYAALCSGDNGRHYSIEIQYRAAQRLTDVDLFIASYESLADCQADISAQLTLMQEQTGLAPVINFCTERLIGNRVYFAHVGVAFGAAIKVPRKFFVPKFPEDQEAVVYEILANAVRSAGGAVARAKSFGQPFDPLGRGVGLAGELVYYAAREIPFLSFNTGLLGDATLESDLLIYGTIDQCLTEMSHLRVALEATENALLEAACTSTQNAGVESPGNYFLSQLMVHTRRFELESFRAASFETYEQCVADREKSIERVRYLNRDRIIGGGFCSMDMFRPPHPETGPRYHGYVILGPQLPPPSPQP